MKRLLTFLLALCVAGAFAAVPAGPVAASSAAPALHVSGNRLVTDTGRGILLHGANRSGTEYACAQGWGIFDGPSDQASVSAMATWGLDAIRVPLNEDCWLGINGANPSYAGGTYRTAIVNYVHLLESNGMTPILDLHWSAPGGNLALGQSPMPDRDHAPAFWTSVPQAFAGDAAIVFDLYNEPEITTYPVPVPVSDWQCWLNGGTCAGVSYQVAGMQELVNAVRATGAKNVILLGGMDYAGDTTDWLQYEPSDPLHDLAASWHTYPGTYCTTSPCLDNGPSALAAAVPLVLGEIGDHNSQPVTFTPALLAWADAHQVSYLGWAWDAWGGSDYILVADYTGTPKPNWGQEYHDHLASLPYSDSVWAPNVSVGSSVTIYTTTYGGRSTGSIYDVEVYNAGGQKVAQQFWSGVDFRPGDPHAQDTAPISGLPSGTYRVAIGVFTADWSKALYWDNSARTFTVS